MMRRKKNTHHDFDHYTPISPREPTAAEDIGELGDNGTIIERG
jgi:hypothetical protein